MSDVKLTPFEASLERRLRAYAAIPVAPASSLDIAREVMAQPAPRGRFGWLTNLTDRRTRRVLRLAIVVALVAVTVATAIYVVGRLRPTPVPIRDLLLSTAVLPAGAGGPAVTLADGRVLLIGGGGVGGQSTLFDPVTNTFAPTGGLNEPRGGLVLAVRLQDGRVLAAGGFTPAEGESRDLRSAEIYDPTTGRWEITDSMTQLHVHCCGERGISLVLVPQAILLDDGRVLIAGGSTGGGVDLYDPATGSFTNVRVACLPRGDMLKLRDGRVLITCVSARTTEIQIFSPESNSFVRGAQPPGSSVGHLSLLPDGRVLFAGWVKDDDRSAQVYDPASDTFSVLPIGGNPEGVARSFAFDDGNVLYVDRNSGRVTVFNPAAMAFESTPAVLPASVGVMVGMADGRVFVLGDDDRAWIVEPVRLPADSNAP